MHPKERTWGTVEALSMACAINREKGFTSVSKHVFQDPGNEERWTNKDMLSYILFPEIAGPNFNVLIKVKPCDLEQANAIIKHYRKLSFGVLGDSINDYLQRVFTVTQSDSVKMSDFGIIASVPSIYEKDIHAKETLEQIKTTKNEHLGTEGQVLELDILVIESKYVEQIGCWGHLAVTSTDYLVSFLSKERLLNRKDVAKIRGKVKRHSQHWKTKTAETALNYVKVLDEKMVWL